jgi:hypothetical protein
MRIFLALLARELSRALRHGSDSLAARPLVTIGVTIPSRPEHPILKQPARMDGSIVAIDHKDSKKKALRLLGELGNSYQAIGVDSSSKAAIDWVSTAFRRAILSRPSPPSSTNAWNVRRSQPQGRIVASNGEDRALD